MSKKARQNLPDKDTHPMLYSMAKKSGRCSGPLKRGIYGTLVTPKIHRSQVSNKNKARATQGLAPLEES
jgi:hypothetical protein